MSADAPPPLDRLVTVRAGEGERAAWRAEADRLGVSLSDLVRARMNAAQPVRRRGRRRPAPRADPALLQQLARIGNNLNQIARRANTAKGVDVEVLAALRSIEEQIDFALAAVVAAAAAVEAAAAAASGGWADGAGEG